MSKQDRDEIERLQKEVAEWKVKAETAARAQPKGARRLTLQVSPKGCVSIYGIGSLGWHPYPEQALKVLQISDDIKAFIWENREKLSWKNRPTDDDLLAMTHPVKA